MTRETIEVVTAWRLWEQAIAQGCKFPAIDFDGTGARKETPYRCRLGEAVGYGVTAEESIQKAYKRWEQIRGDTKHAT